MKNLKVDFKNIRKRLGAVGLSVVLSTVGIGGLSGCSKDSKFKSDYSSTVYSVEKSDDQKEIENLRFTTVDNMSYWKKIDSKHANYDRYIDLGKVSKDVDLGRNYTDKDLDYVYPYKTCNFKNHFLEGDKIKTFKNDNRSYETMTNATFRGHGRVVLPDSLKWAKRQFGPAINDHNIDQLIEMEYLLGTNGNLYMHYEYTCAAKKKINAPAYTDGEYIEKYGMPKDIKKGDYIHYEALYLYNRDKSKIITLADKQTGLGSNDKNVKEKTFGNYDEVIKPITNKKEESKSESFDSNTEFKEFAYEKGQVKQKVKVK